MAYPRMMFFILSKSISNVFEMNLTSLDTKLNQYCRTKDNYPTNTVKFGHTLQSRNESNQPCGVTIRGSFTPSLTSFGLISKASKSRPAEAKKVS